VDGGGSGDDDLPDAGQAPSAGEDASPQPFTAHRSASSEGAASHAGGDVECSSAEDSDGGRARSGASSRYEHTSKSHFLILVPTAGCRCNLNCLFAPLSGEWLIKLSS